MNPDRQEYAVSLHRKSRLCVSCICVAKLIYQVYAPPNAAKEGCQIFDEETGKATHVIQYDLYSEMGQRLKCGKTCGHRVMGP